MLGLNSELKEIYLSLPPECCSVVKVWSFLFDQRYVEKEIL